MKNVESEQWSCHVSFFYCNSFEVVTEHTIDFDVNIIANNLLARK